jgi:osmotically-inducible protein OsmY
MKRPFAILFAAALLLATGCASTSNRESTGQYIDDSAITTKVKKAIFDEPSLKVAQISVETYKSVVQLSGFVDSAAQIGTAGSVARAVEGVTSVKNDLRLKY